MRYGYMPFAHFTQWSRSHKLRNHLRPALPRHSLMNDLDSLESESAHILREVVACMRRPVLLYSIGKDSSVLLHLARKAFAPAPLPFPLLHVDTGWKFREMIAFRERVAAAPDVRMLVHTNQEGVRAGINPISHGASVHVDVMKVAALRQALELHGFDAAVGGARRDEEKSRAKERIFSHRNAQQRWEPRQQRPELWALYNTRLAPGESLRVFPLSNWTELDVWRYIRREKIEVVPLYFAAARLVVEREGALIMVDDERLPLRPGERPQLRRVRFRSLGCYPLTVASESDADTLDAIIDEMQHSRRSERAGRLLDASAGTSLEQKKREGHF